MNLKACECTRPWLENKTTKENRRESKYDFPILYIIYDFIAVHKRNTCHMPHATCMYNITEYYRKKVKKIYKNLMWCW